MLSDQKVKGTEIQTKIHAGTQITRTTQHIDCVKISTSSTTHRAGTPLLQPIQETRECQVQKISLTNTHRTKVASSVSAQTCSDLQSKKTTLMSPHIPCVLPIQQSSLYLVISHLGNM
jgi:ubiquitin C-terminal hydrolase